ncbi:MAG: hypothetical protein A2Y21_07075 [Clostridiales bacterium GWC2_40_7]|nr:MAG: hypothetical protein A2Y21_07075 [Clostridiales bacterium GWC2_40_7]
MAEILSIDIGTTNWKTVIFNEKGKIAASAKCPARTISDNKGFQYYSPDEIWESVAALIGELREKHTLDNVAAVVVSSMGESVVPIGKDGKTLCNIIPWFDDRSIQQSRDFAQRIGSEKIFSITGLDPAPVFTVSKILWIKQNYPEVYEKTVKWLQMADYINYMLTGNLVTDYSLASRTMYFDINKNDWSDEIAYESGIDKKVFPDIIKSTSIIGYVNSEAARATNLTIGTPVVMGGHDHPCATIAAGVFDGETVFDSSGTAESFLYVSSKGALLPEKRIGQRQCRHLDPQRYILWGGIISSGISVDWAIKRLALSEDWGIQLPYMTFNEILCACKDIPCGSEGVMFLPHLRGSGAPYWDTQMKGAFLGLSTKHNARHMIRSVIEGLSYQAAMIVRMFEELSEMQIKRLYCAGGGAKLQLWQQTKADVTGKCVEAMHIDEATCFGTVVLAGVGIGLYKDMESGALEIKAETIRYIPDEKNNLKYQELYEIFRSSYHSLEAINRQLDFFAREK